MARFVPTRLRVQFQQRQLGIKHTVGNKNGNLGVVPAAAAAVVIEKAHRFLSESFTDRSDVIVVAVDDATSTVC